MVMARPGYACYRNVLKALGCEVVEIDCGPETRFQPTVHQLEALAGPIAGLVIASPANPTGTMLLPDELDAIAEWCEARGVRLISDEIYHGIDYALHGPAQRPPLGLAHLALRDRVRLVQQVLLDDRVASGWMLVPEALRRPVDVLTGNLTICPPVLSQHAAIAAFTPESYAELDGHVARYAANRDSSSSACRAWASTGWRRPTGPSTSTPTSATSPTTPTPGASGCSRRPAWRPPRASTSTPSGQRVRADVLRRLGEGDRRGDRAPRGVVALSAVYDPFDPDVPGRPVPGVRPSCASTTPCTTTPRATRRLPTGH